jgi:hypothetical protein
MNIRKWKIRNFPKKREPRGQKRGAKFFAFKLEVFLTNKKLEKIRGYGQGDRQFNF